MPILLDLFLTFAKIGAFTFGGGYAMISLLDHECVEKKKWITADEFSDITVIAESTPGPIAINCSTYTGYTTAGFPGALVATCGMVLPSFCILLLISYFLDDLLAYPVVANAFRGIRAAVAILIFRAGSKMVRQLMKKTPNKKHSIAFIALFFAVTFFVNIFGVHLSTIWLILVAGLTGFFLYGLPRKEAAK